MDTSRLEYALRQHAYVMGQVALLNAEVAAMQAENSIAIQNGNTPPYNDQSFVEVTERYNVDHNSVIGAFTY